MDEFDAMKLIRTFLFVLVVMAIFSSENASAHVSAAIIDKHIDTLYVSYNQSTPQVADTAALYGCRALAKKAKLKTADCKIVQRSKGVGWTAVVCAPAKKDCAIVTGYETQVSAISAGQTECANAYAGFCNEGAWNAYDEVEAPLSANVDNNCAPPSGPELRYNDTCRNGGCVREFENGCQRRFQAPYCFNPIKNKFEFMPDGCP